MLFAEDEKRESIIKEIFAELDKRIEIKKTIGEQNRNDSFKQLQKENLNTQETLVISAIHDGYCNARDIAEYIGVEVQTVRARLTELAEKKYIEEKGKVYYSPTNRMITTYGFINKLF